MELIVFSGSASPLLAASVSQKLGRPLGACRLQSFPDGEVSAQIEQSVRGRDVFIIQPTSPPVNEHLMELLVMIDALHRASAQRITAVVPYFGYSRQERRATGREPITAALVANLLATARADRVVTIDLHAPAIEGFFDIWVDQLTAVPLLVHHLKQRPRPGSVLVAPDVGAVKRADRHARLLHIPTALALKRHHYDHDGTGVEVYGLVGEVAGLYPIIVDDMISTGTTIHGCVEALLKAGSRPEMTVVATHAVLVGQALRYLSNPAIREVVVTDTVPLPPEKRLDMMTVVSVADLLAEAIYRLNQDESISALTFASLDRR